MVTQELTATVIESTPRQPAPPVSLETGWVRRAQAGDVGAFEGLYRRHVERIYALCLRLTADPAAAEELTQAAFVRAWEKLGSFRGKSAFGTWLHRLTVNLAVSERRSRHRWSWRIAPVEELQEVPAANPPPSAPLELERAIATLPPKARQVFVLYDVEGFSHDEISRLTGIAQGTSKAQLHRARKLLRRALGGSADHEEYTS